VMLGLLTAALHDVGSGRELPARLDALA
jgi:hypothetical protein